MSGEHLNAQARVVLTGLDADGKSAFISDGNTTTRTAQPGFTVMDVWQFDSLPVDVLAPSTLGATPSSTRRRTASGSASPASRRTRSSTPRATRSRWTRSTAPTRTMATPVPKAECGI